MVKNSNLNNLLDSLAKQFKETDTYKNLPPSEQEKINLLIEGKQGIPNPIEPKQRPLKRVSKTTTYQLKVSLKDTHPPVWRRIVVPGYITFHQLHQVIQTAMGWGGYHLYSFEIEDVEIQLPDDDFGIPDSYRDIRNANKEKLGYWIHKEKQSFNYTYDFGDNWEHKIIVEKMEKRNEPLEHPLCIKGKRACPPDDIGGTTGYSQILNMLENKNNGTGNEDEWLKELEEMFGEFEQDEFDLEEVNLLLEELEYE
ncbi:plasmid pRiA4b ORF-3 family protein [Bacillus massilinigeriensis]|uniref:plasmid pRiA4b ORF-3 family protein n=1 Tax=Bacillus massilionigeriensis TaxID=1805475 RepID=UPI000A052FAB|nr:plasmid pRiA4b ORF-3 family protein [Bacillus massilionigeriensis]